MGRPVSAVGSLLEQAMVIDQRHQEGQEHDW